MLLVGGLTPRQRGKASSVGGGQVSVSSFAGEDYILTMVSTD